MHSQQRLIYIDKVALRWLFATAFLGMLLLLMIDTTSAGGFKKKKKGAFKAAKTKAVVPDAEASWREYLAAAPGLSMGPAAFRGLGGRSVAPLEGTAPRFRDPRVAQAVEMKRVIDKLDLLGSKLVAGVPIKTSDVPELLRGARLERGYPDFVKELPKLAGDAVRGRLFDDPENIATIAGATFNQFQREQEAAEVAKLAHALGIISWKRLQPIFEPKAGPEAEKPLLKVEIQEVPSLRYQMSLLVTNASRKDLHQVTMRLRTGLSRTFKDDLADYYLHRAVWKADETISFDRTTISRLTQTPQRGPVRDAIGVSVWCTEGHQDVAYDLKAQRPRVRYMDATPDKQIAAKLPKRAIVTYSLTARKAKHTP